MHGGNTKFYGMDEMNGNPDIKTNSVLNTPSSGDTKIMRERRGGGGGVRAKKEKRAERRVVGD